MSGLFALLYGALLGGAKIVDGIDNLQAKQGLCVQMVKSKGLLNSVRYGLYRRTQKNQLTVE